MHTRFLYILIIFTFFQVPLYGIEKDSVAHCLDAVVVESSINQSPLKISYAGVFSLKMDIMHRFPKILGNADPLRYSQFLPGVQTNAEYDAGLHIYGCDNSHNLISIENVPVYNPAHMLGLFSVFNPAHFSSMSLTTHSDAATTANRIGGILNMTLYDTIPPKPTGSFDVGVLSSQGNLRLPVSEKSLLSISFRASYLNLLYASLLKFEDSRVRYSFGDVNISYLHKFNNKNTICVDFYSGKDEISLDDSNVDFSTDVKWGNTLASIHWKHSGAIKVNQSIYYTGYKNKMFVAGSGTCVALPSRIYDLGYNADARYHNLAAGFSFVNHHIEPQRPQFEESSINPVSDTRDFNTYEASLYAKYSGEISYNLRYELAAKGVAYANETTDYTHCSVNPSAKLLYDNIFAGCFEVGYTLHRQYMLNTGFTSMGLPVEFWLSCDVDKKPYSAHSFHFAYSVGLLDNRYSVGVNLYYKRLFNQIEYNATPLDIYNKEYSINNVLLKGNGKNYGVNVIAKKNVGAVVGWVSYSYGRALRKFPQYGNKYIPANHERIHELNAVCTYRLNKKWDFGAVFVFASGNPFTAPKQFYILNGNIVSEFGEHNANRTRSYSRLDISANYDIVNRRGKTMGVNISLYNVLLSKNDLYNRLKVYKGKFYYASVRFFTRILPSISFYYKF